MHRAPKAELTWMHDRAQLWQNTTTELPEIRSPLAGQRKRHARPRDLQTTKRPGPQNFGAKHQGVLSSSRNGMRRPATTSGRIQSWRSGMRTSTSPLPPSRTGGLDFPTDHKALQPRFDLKERIPAGGVATLEIKSWARHKEALRQQRKDEFHSDNAGQQLDNDTTPPLSYRAASPSLLEKAHAASRLATPRLAALPKLDNNHDSPVRKAQSNQLEVFTAEVPTVHQPERRPDFNEGAVLALTPPAALLALQVHQTRKTAKKFQVGVILKRKRRKAARVIQACFRGYRMRMWLALSMRGARKIQRVWKPKFLRKKAMKRKILKCWRRFKSKRSMKAVRRFIQLLRYKREARVRLLQSIWRRTRAKQRVQLLRTGVAVQFHTMAMLAFAAIVIQGLLKDFMWSHVISRYYCTRVQVRTVRPAALRLASTHHRDCNASVTCVYCISTLQAAVRGWIYRFGRKCAAAIVMQCAVRCHLSRRELRRRQLSRVQYVLATLAALPPFAQPLCYTPIDVQPCTEVCILHSRML